MIINDIDAQKRLTSPMNLINKLKEANPRKSAMSLFGVGRSIEKVEIKSAFNPFESRSEASEPLAITSLTLPDTLQASATLDNILENHDSQIKLGLAHDKALDLLTRSVDSLALKLDDVRADRLPSVVAAASKVVESIRRERSEQAKNGKDREVHYHFYTPSQKAVSDYEVIDVGVEA